MASMGRWLSGLFALLMLTSGWLSVALGGGLKRFERAHTSNDSDSSKSSSSKSSKSSSSSSSDYETSYDDDSSSSNESSDSSDDGTNLAVLLMAPCIVPLFAPACFHPSHHPSREPYHERGLYVEPLDGDEATSVRSRNELMRTDFERRRWFEIQTTGYGVMNEKYIGSHDLDLTVFAGPVIIHAGWEHFYERVDGTGPLEHLNLINAHLGTNLLGPHLHWLELYWFAGASAIIGEETTPAFDAGAEVRVYPVEPMTIHTSAVFSVFEIGPVLVDARWQLGLAFDRFEVRLGPRWLYQGDAQGFWGPSAAFAARF
jgi:hypothetical protein